MKTRVTATGLALGLALLLPSLAAHANQRELAYWTHGNWNVALVENIEHDIRTCRVWTGGDGIGTVSLTVGEGGFDAAFSYQPVTFRGMAPPMELDDDVMMIFDGQESWIAEEMEIFGWYDDSGIYQVDAALSNYLVAETVQSLEAANTLLMGTHRGGQSHVIDSFLLSGFTATWLKAADWCGFDPDKQFQTS
ncbi:hypothetical protein [Pseudooceanicola sp. HF7]|uniref:hypothetical protein n=1 Tax=Pseudooceanicola sp. HF7 TaxID=2721560 RepID=UPI0014310887|nr:hypothetical protein [Pseudooceanicola sp. HF7]NIZ08013.1 hypothetical protein [Pseudooceanicola sp. HF7]